MKKVLIAGGGFGGIVAARQLAKNQGLEVTLITDSEFFRYCPSLYRVVTGYLRRQAIMHIRDLVPDNIEVVVDKVTLIDRALRTLRTESGKTHQYDYVILSLGVVTSYFGISGLEQYSYGIKSIEDINKLHEHLHGQITSSGELDKNYIVVGGGPTGVELSAGLSAYLRTIAKKHRIKRHKVNIELIEAAPRILPSMHPTISKKATKRLRKLKVKVSVDSKVEGETASSLVVSGRSIPTQTVIWTAGVANHPFYKNNEDQFELSKRGKVVVNEHLQVDKHVFVIGDNAETTYSGMAQTAVHQGHYAAHALSLMAVDITPKAYAPKTPAYVVPVGRNWAVMQWGLIKTGGMMAGMMRRFADLIGYADVMSWSKAVSLWTRTDDIQETCPKCSRLHTRVASAK